MSEQHQSVEEEKEMSFVEHLDELRMHLIRMSIAIGIFSVFAFFATELIFKEILLGPLQDHFLTYRVFCKLSTLLELGNALCYEPVDVRVETLDMGEAFLLHIKVCVVSGVVIAFPYLLWEVWRFISPGLYTEERKAASSLVAVGSFLFLLGISFGFFILSPFAINFLAGYTLPGINVETTGKLLKASSLINYMIMFTFPVGIIFELPIVVYFLAKIGMVTDKGMKHYRRHAIVGILVLAAVLTPPDVMTQILVGIPIYILYELSIGIAARETRKREAILNS